MVFDHHRRAPFSNLYTEISAGEGNRLWQGGGDESDGPMSGAWETFWNVTAAHPVGIAPWAIQGNFIGVTSGEKTQTPTEGNWL